MVAFLYFTSFDTPAYCFGFMTTPPPQPYLEKKTNNLILFKLKNKNEKKIKK